MALAHSPSIVTDGLLVYVDAANPKSYPSSGGTWSDISGRGYTAAIANAQTFSTTYGGGINTPANQVTTYISMPIQALQSLSNGNIWTMEWTMTPLSGTAGVRYGPHMTIGGGNEFIWVYDTTNGNISYLFGHTSLDSGAHPTFAINVPMAMSLTKSGSTFRVYKNGVFAGQYTGNDFNAQLVQSWVLDQEQDAVGGSFDVNQSTNANWHNVKLYNRILTDSEIAQNFNALRGRYGL